MLGLQRLQRFIVESSRPDDWKEGSRRYKRLHPACEICGLKKDLEAHDVVPYHLITDPELRTVDFWLQNFISLCRHDHCQHGHCGDTACLQYNPNIRELAAEVASFRQYCTS